MSASDLLKLLGTTALALVLLGGPSFANNGEHEDTNQGNDHDHHDHEHDDNDDDGGNDDGGDGGNGDNGGGGDGDDYSSIDVISNVVNGQLNLGNVWSEMNMTVYDVEGDVTGTSAAIGNSFSANLGGDATVQNVQRTTGAIGSRVNATIEGIGGDVDLTSAAVGNTASINNQAVAPCGEEVDCTSIDDASLNLVNNQRVGNQDPHSSLSFTAGGVGNVTGTSAAISNSLSVQAWNSETNVTTSQRADGPTSSRLNATISDATSVALTSAAVGNTVSIDTLGGGD